MQGNDEGAVAQRVLEIRAEAMHNFGRDFTSSGYVASKDGDGHPEVPGRYDPGGATHTRQEMNLNIMQRQRQAGFIRNYSNKQLTPFQPEPSEFSYFRTRPNRDEADEFSPYKIEQNERDHGEERGDRERGRREMVRPPLPHRQGRSG